MADPDKPDKRLKRLEGGLTERQKVLARHIVAMYTADVLQEESLVDSGVNNYEDLYQLTQSDGFIRWQETMLQRDYGTDVTAAQAVLSTAIQLESADLLMQCLQGYTVYVRRQLQVALANIKHAAYRVLAAQENEVTVFANDQDGTQWQMYTTPEAPDSVKIRRALPSKLNPPKGGKKKKLTRKKRGTRKSSTSSSLPSPPPRERSE